jgi:hypothetical protein
VTIFPPSSDAPSVALIENRLGLPGAARLIPFEQINGTKERFCFDNVKGVIAERGGAIVYGWLVWQHESIFVEAEHHAIWQKPSGDVVCITPQTPPENSVTFIPDPSTVFDFDTRLLTKNVRVALMSDSRLEEFFRVADRQTDLLNAGQRLDSNSVVLEKKDAYLYHALDMQKTTLLTQVMMSNGSSPHPDDLTKKVGRNEPCPCGSGQKFKKCHGA